MPRKPSKSTETQPSFLNGKHYLSPKSDFGGFINIRVDDANKVLFHEWYAENRGEVLSALDNLMGEGMKVSLAYDGENDCYTCSFTGKGWASSLMRWCMTTKAGTFDEVIALSLYKHFIMAEEDWGDYQPKTGEKKFSWG